MICSTTEGGLTQRRAGIDWGRVSLAGCRVLRPFWVADGGFFTSDAPVNLACVLSATVSAEVSVGLTLLRWLWAKQGVCSKHCISSSALDVGVILMRARGWAGVSQCRITKNRFLLPLWSQVQMSRRLSERHPELVLLLLLLD